MILFLIGKLENGVTNGVPLNSMLWPHPFTICTNDLDEEIKCMVARFANDRKIGE